MLSRRSILLTAFCAVSLACVTPAHAHKAARVETQVTLSKTGELDVTHVLQLSAAQRLLYNAGIIETNDLTGLKARAQAALYSSERFKMKADGDSVPLTILGAEIIGGHLYIYQTGSLSSLPKIWSAQNSILRDLNPQFDNVVNVPTLDGIRTIVFRGADLDLFQSTS